MANGLFQPLKVLRTLMAFGAKVVVVFPLLKSLSLIELFISCTFASRGLNLSTRGQRSGYIIQVLARDLFPPLMGKSRGDLSHPSEFLRSSFGVPSEFVRSSFGNFSKKSNNIRSPQKGCRIFALRNLQRGYRQGTIHSIIILRACLRNVPARDRETGNE